MIHIYDTTLRDGTQGEGVWLSCGDKLRIAERLDRLGVAFIEGGFPGSNPKDTEFFARARDMEWTHAQIAAFGATRRLDLAVEDDANIKALLGAGTGVCTIFGKSWMLHVTEVLRATADDNLRIIEETVAYLVSQGKRVIYDAEHFFDGYRADPAYALETTFAAVRGGAEAVALCDTNGGTLPWQVGDVVAQVVAAVPVPVGFHGHDDIGCAVASTLFAVRAGATQVQGTINGYGERCGNANLCAIIPNLELKMGLLCLPPGRVSELCEVSRLVSEVANLAPEGRMAYVGQSAFAHKGGVHVAAIRRSTASYNHINPALVGNETRVVVSDLSGRGNVLAKAEEMGMEVGEGVGDVLGAIKDNEALGFSYEAAEASVALLIARRSPGYQPPFRLIDYMVTVEHRDLRGSFAEATVKVMVGGEVAHTAAEGNGPVSALDRALRKALEPVYPDLARIKLIDYKVRIIDGDKATGATTRVLIECANGTRSWGTVGASPNIIEASWRALVDAIEYGLSIINSATAQALVDSPAPRIVTSSVEAAS